MGRFVAAVDDDTVQIAQFFHKTVQQRLFSGDIFPESFGYLGAGGGEAENAGGAFGAASETTFLTAAQEQGWEGSEPGADVQRAAALWPVDFMGGYGN